MYVGCHVSIRGGYLAAAKTALALGAGAFQYFPKNPRSLAVKAFDPRDAEACRAFCRKQGIVSIAHTSYPANLAAAPGPLFEATADSLRNDLEIAEACGSIGVVVHFGQYKGADVLEGYRLMIRMVNDILDGWSGEAKLLVENNAGQGSRMGTTLEELTQVRELLNHPHKVGFCFDTCHAFASGLWTGDDWERVADSMRKLGYLDALAAVHLNDSVYPAGSFRDRHAPIGRGAIGREAFVPLLRTPELQGIPVVLETPRPPGGGHREEIALVRELAGP